MKLLTCSFELSTGVFFKIYSPIFSSDLNPKSVLQEIDVKENKKPIIINLIFYIFLIPLFL